jgi:Domain of unknown function (DUF4338)
MMKTMTDFIKTYSGRNFTLQDLELIKWTRDKYPSLSRSELSGTICEIIEWTNPAGNAKTVPCMKFLEILENEGIINLPPLKVSSKRTKKELNIQLNESKIDCNINSIGPIKLEIAYAGNDLNRWKACVDKYHILGYRQAFGSRLHYFIKSEERELGCIQFSASSWALSEREEWIGWNLEDRKQRLHLIINNSRFLIFPWVKVKYLASKVLSMVAKKIRADWIKEYCYAPVLLETFVDLAHFQGTCYKAANWIYLGETKGRGRMDRNKECKLSKKAIFMYPLQNDFRDYLKGEKLYKVVNPDE